MNPVKEKEVLSSSFVYKIVYEFYRVDKCTGPRVDRLSYHSQIKVYQAVMNPMHVSGDFAAAAGSQSIWQYVKLGNHVSLGKANLESDFADILHIMLGKITTGELRNDPKLQLHEFYDAPAKIVKLYTVEWQIAPYGRDTGSEHSDPHNDIRLARTWKFSHLSEFDHGEELVEEGTGSGLLAVGVVHQKLVGYQEGSGHAPTFTEKEINTICGFEAYGHVFAGRPHRTGISGKCISGTYVDDEGDDGINLDRGDRYEVLNSYHVFGEAYAIGNSIYMDGKVLIKDVIEFVTTNFTAGIKPAGELLAEFWCSGSGNQEVFANILCIIAGKHVEAYHSRGSMSCVFPRPEDMKATLVCPCMAITNDGSHIHAPQTAFTAEAASDKQLLLWIADNRHRIMHLCLACSSNSIYSRSGVWVAPTTDGGWKLENQRFCNHILDLTMPKCLPDK